MTARIQFFPATKWKHTIESGNYRWLFENTTKYVYAFKKGKTSFDPRMSEENYTLSIHGARAGDEGKYKVQCWYKNTLISNSTSVDLTLQEPLITVTTIKPENNVTETTKGIAFSIIYFDYMSM